MKKTLSLILPISILLISCQSTKNAISTASPIIFTTDIEITSHAKKISKEKEKVQYIPDSESTKKFNTTQALFITKKGSRTSLLGPHERLLVLDDESKGTQFEQTKDYILKIRDFFASNDEKFLWKYHENAGSYLYLLSTTKEDLEKRLSRYKIHDFLIIGDLDMERFIYDFKLGNYHQGTHDVKKVNSDQGYLELLLAFMQKNEVNYLFTTSALNEPTKEKFKNASIHVKIIPEMSEDSSEWGYLRWMEKTIESFIDVFDTYD